MRNIRIFDNQGKTIDRYTIVIQDEALDTEDIYTMSARPNSPQGVNQYCCTVPLGDSEPSSDEVEIFDGVPESIYSAVTRRFDQGA